MSTRDSNRTRLAEVRGQRFASAASRFALFAVVFECGCVPHPPPASELLKQLAQEGYTANPGLSGLIDPGNVIQTAELGPNGQPRPLVPPLILAWASDCFPGQLPREGPFAVASGSGGSVRALALEGPDISKFIPNLRFEMGAVSQYRLSLRNPRIRAFAKTELSNRMSPKCVEALANALREGDRPEWYSMVIESVVVESLSLVITWNSGISADVRERVTAEAAKTVSDIPVLGNVSGGGAQGTDQPPSQGTDATGQYRQGGPYPQQGAPLLPTGGPRLSIGTPSGPGAKVRIAMIDEENTAIDLAGNVIVAYRTRPIQPRRVPTSDLRDSFQAPTAGGAAPVGRLAVRQLIGGSYHRVRLDHAFRSGDAFQFDVTSNRGGWLFVFHAVPGDTPELLWPRLGSQPGRYLDRNEIRAQEPAVVPSSPAYLRFDENSGTELFYIVLRTDPGIPQLAAAARQGIPTASAEGGPFTDSRVARPAYLAAAAQTSSAGSEAVVQFAVRGSRPGSARGVLYDPGEADPDPSVYFSVAPGDPSSDVIFEFRLIHN